MAGLTETVKSAIQVVVAGNQPDHHFYGDGGQNRLQRHLSGAGGRNHRFSLRNSGAIEVTGFPATQCFSQSRCVFAPGAIQRKFAPIGDKIGTFPQFCGKERHGRSATKLKRIHGCFPLFWSAAEVPTQAIKALVPGDFHNVPQWRSVISHFRETGSPH